MVADVSVYSMLQPAKPTEGPMDQYGRMLALKSLIGQNETADLQRSKMKRDLEEEEAVRALYAGSTPEQMSAPDFLQRVMGVSPARGMQLQKTQLETEKTRGEITKTKLEAFASSAKQLRDMAAQASSDADMPRIREFAMRFAGPDVARTIPETFSPQWQQTFVMNGDKAIERMTPKFEKVDIGGTVQMIDVNPFTNPAVKGMNLQKTATPGETLSAQTTRRGQDITNARERDVTLAGNLAEAREMGQGRAAAAMALPQAVANAERGVRLLDELVKHPGLSATVGGTLTPGARFIPGTNAADFQARLDEIKGGAFMEAFNSLRGGGQITEREGEKATAAITRMSLSQSEAEFKKAAAELQDVIRAGLARAQQRAGAQPTGGAQPAAPAAAAAAGGRAFQSMPDPAQYRGRIVRDTGSGVRYQSDGASWRRVTGASGGF